jgi:hypothetical protein
MTHCPKYEFHATDSTEMLPFKLGKAVTVPDPGIGVLKLPLL